MDNKGKPFLIQGAIYDITEFKKPGQKVQLEHPESFSEIITCDPCMTSMFEYMESIAKTNKPVLITGETGVGKELIVRAFHALIGSDKPFVTVNVAGLDDILLSIQSIMSYGSAL